MMMYFEKLYSFKRNPVVNPVSNCLQIMITHFHYAIKSLETWWNICSTIFQLPIIKLQNTGYNRA